MISSQQKEMEAKIVFGMRVALDPPDGDQETRLKLIVQEEIENGKGQTMSENVNVWQRKVTSIGRVFSE